MSFVSAGNPIVIASRQSPLARAQAEIVRTMLEAAGQGNRPEDKYSFEIKTYVTSGDRQQQGALADIGGKGLFTREVETALLAGAADIAVHSFKDMPALMPDGLVTGAIPQREIPYDAFLSPVAKNPMDLPEGAVLGTSSVRRAAQIRHRRPDLRIAPLRGSVGTRLDKLARGEVAATFLAEAGLQRLGLTTVARKTLSADEMLPALCQGALLVQIPRDRSALARLLAPLVCPKTSLEITAERALLLRLDGSCRTPIAGLAQIMECGDQTVSSGPVLRFRAELYSPDGQNRAGFDESLSITPQTGAADVHHWADTLGKTLLKDAASFWPNVRS